jgi:hypothetical protein
MASVRLKLLDEHDVRLKSKALSFTISVGLLMGTA